MKHITTLAGIAALSAIGLIGGVASAQIVPPVMQPRVPSLPPIQQPQPIHQQQPIAPQVAPQGQIVGSATLSADAQPYQATLSSVSNGMVQVRFGTGVTQSYSVDASSSAALSAQVGHPVAFRLVKGTFQLAKDAKWATLEAVKSGVATLRDDANHTMTYTVDASTAARLQGNVGKRIAYVASGNAIVLANAGAPR